MSKIIARFTKSLKPLVDTFWLVVSIPVIITRLPLFWSWNNAVNIDKKHSAKSWLLSALRCYAVFAPLAILSSVYLVSTLNFFEIQYIDRDLPSLHAVILAIYALSPLICLWWFNCLIAITLVAGGIGAIIGALFGIYHLAMIWVPEEYSVLTGGIIIATAFASMAISIKISESPQYEGVAHGFFENLFFVILIIIVFLSCVGYLFRGLA
jgi:hypothetical protein